MCPRRYGVYVHMWCVPTYVHSPMCIHVHVCVWLFQEQLNDGQGREVQEVFYM